MLLQQEIRISDQGSRSYARATSCNFYIEQRLFGYRAVFLEAWTIVKVSLHLASYRQVPPPS
jgi:hypothetical protein